MDTTQPLTRRGLLRLAAGIAATATLTPALAYARTPRQMEGPFYPTPEQLALRVGALRDNDLTRVPGMTRDALGEALLITGVVREPRGRPLRGAVVEIWQACDSGRYLASKDRRRSRQHDPGFQYFGVCPVDRDGHFAFRTIRPPAYPAGVIPGWVRPPHIHVRVRHTDLPDFVTQLYWDDPSDPQRIENRRLQRKDLLIRKVAASRRDKLIRPVELAAPRGVTLASFDGFSLGSFGGSTLDAPRRLHFPIELAQDLYMP